MSDENQKSEPVVMRAKTLWEGGLRCNTMIRGFEVQTDDPIQEWGTNTGPSPTETFLGTIGACLTSTYAWTALTSRIHHAAITTTVHGTMEEVNGNHRLTKIEINLKASAVEGTPEKLERIFELAHEKCLLVNSVGIDTKLNFEYKIVDE